MKPALNQAYVMGLLADVERRVVELEVALAQGRTRGAAVEGELSATLQRFDAARQTVAEYKHAAEAAARTISDNNGKLATAHRDVGALQRKSDELLDAMKAAADPDAQRQIRRSRAAVIVDIQDQQKVVAQLTHVVEKARADLAAAQQAMLEATDRERLVSRELDMLTVQLPDPALYLQLFAARASRAHCVFFLERKRPEWLSDLEQALGSVSELHSALRAGRYRLDTHSELIGGRAHETAEALYAWVAMGNLTQAQELFALVTDPSLFFHHIFHVFRIWCLGLYLNGHRAELGQLVELHLYADGLRGAYAQAFAAILQHDGRAFAQATRSLVQKEWQGALRSPRQALAVVNVNAVALCRLAAANRLPLPELGPTVPRELLVGRPSKSARDV